MRCKKVSLKEVISAIPHLEGSTHPKVKAVHGQATPVCYNRVKKRVNKKIWQNSVFCLLVGRLVACFVVVKTSNDEITWSDSRPRDWNDSANLCWSTADRCSVCSLSTAPYSIFGFFLDKNIEKWREVNLVGGCRYVLGLPCYDFKKGLISKRTECW